MNRPRSAPLIVPMGRAHIDGVNWLTHNVLAQARPIDAWRNDLNTDHLYGWVALHAPAQVVGFIQGSILAPEAEIRHLAVAPEWRRAGLGRRLTDCFLHRARTADVAQVLLEVRAGGHAAQGLYAALGFVSVGRRRGYYQGPSEDALLLALTL